MRVIETFGPTIQGEGPYAGHVCHFIRFGGCDYRCSWCDSMMAVDPTEVRQADNLTPGEAARRLLELPPAPMLVISGGNPALQKLDPFLDHVRARYHILAVETQGSVYRPWLYRIDSLVVSPKPPSSGMASGKHWRRFEAFMHRTAMHPDRVLKIVCFDDDDLDWATMVRHTWPSEPFYLSVGTDPEDTPGSLGARYAWLCGRVIDSPDLHNTVVLPQLHVIAWGHRVGV